MLEGLETPSADHKDNSIHLTLHNKNFRMNAMDLEFHGLCLRSMGNVLE